jgi:hypothetical protein
MRVYDERFREHENERLADCYNYLYITRTPSPTSAVDEMKTVIEFTLVTDAVLQELTSLNLFP